MNKDEIVEDANHLPGWQKHRFMLMVGGSIVIALMLVAVAMKLYATSGAAQLDLSRPGYEHVSEQVSRTEVFKGFSPTGDMDKEAYDEFRKMYKDRATEATAINSFGGDVMGDAALVIDAPSTGSAQ